MDVRDQQTDASQVPRELCSVTIKNSGEFPTHGTHLTVGGVEVPELANVQIEHRAGYPAHLTAHINCINGLDVSLPAVVDVVISAFPGFDLVEDKRAEGVVRYSCVPSKESV